LDKINLIEKLSRFGDHFHPKVIAELNGQMVKLVKFQGPFVWHHHDAEDELFLVLAGAGLSYQTPRPDDARTYRIGVNDLLADMGLAGQLDHPKVREVYARTIEACRKHGKHVGVGGLSTRPKLAAEFIAMGARLLSTGTDIQFLLAAMTEKAKQVHEIPVT